MEVCEDAHHLSGPGKADHRFRAVLVLVELTTRQFFLDELAFKRNGKEIATVQFVLVAKNSYALFCRKSKMISNSCGG